MSLTHVRYIKRQYSKSDLASLVEDSSTNPGPGSDVQTSESGSVDESCCRPPINRRHATQQRMSLTSKDVLQLLYPTQEEGKSSCKVDSGCCASMTRANDDVDAEEGSTHVSDHILLQTMSQVGREVCTSCM